MYNNPINPNNKQGWKQGYYVPINKQKFIGILDNRGVPYRSSLELKFMQMIDANIDVLRWSYENPNTVIQYHNPVKNKICSYNPDFYMEMMTKSGIRIFLIEVKPMCETVCPDKNNFKNDKQYKRQLTVNVVVEVKRRAAVEFCKTKGWKYIFITEEFFK